jgi:competence protein ComEC
MHVVRIVSHPDFDHYSFIESIKRHLKQVCLDGPSWNMINKKAIGAANIHACPKALALNYQFYLPRAQQSKDDNLNSQIAFSKTWLIPGDAPQSSEKKWLALRPPISSISKLILGHHGSKTSTSNSLLNELDNLRQCVASSRKKKYGHPHRDVRLRIQTHCSLILTEDWNHLHFLESI